MNFSLKLILISSFILLGNSIKPAALDKDFPEKLEKESKTFKAEFSKEKYKSIIYNNLLGKLNQNLAILNNEPFDISKFTDCDSYLDLNLPFLVEDHWADYDSKHKNDIQDFNKKYISLNFEDLGSRILQDHYKKEYVDSDKLFWQLPFNFIVECTRNLKELNDDVSKRIFTSYEELLQKKISAYWKFLQIIKESKPSTVYRLFSRFIKQPVKSLMPKSKL